MPQNQPHTTMAKQYKRSPRLRTEIGLLQSAPIGKNQFIFSGHGKDVLFIGIGPDPKSAEEAILEYLSHAGINSANSIAYVESAEFVNQMPEAWANAIPKPWQQVQIPAKISASGKQEILPDISQWTNAAQNACIAIYKPGLKLFPSFYGRLAAKVRAASLKNKTKPEINAKKNKILLAGNEGDLLIPELIQNFKAQGCDLTLTPTTTLPAELPKLLSQINPDLFFCVNFNGLDPSGELFYLLDEYGVCTATWCVDNPWNLLSAMRSPFWRQMHIFVTDHSFIDGLNKHGAQHVTHLPLAAWPELFSVPKSNETYESDLVFAGRTEFPNKNKFFAGCNINSTLLKPALKDTLTGNKADFIYWLDKLGIQQLWPGQDIREAGFAAETCSLAWRTACVKAALDFNFTLYGNKEWLAELPELEDRLKGTRDYYTELPEIYTKARLVLNTTSLLLPAGLTQRNFDAWAAGSICLSDTTPGLNIFPAEQLEHVCFNTPDELNYKAKEILASPCLQKELKKKWRELILQEHTYANRIKMILARCLN